MGRRLYIGNLNYRVTDRDLERLFRPYGTIKSVQIMLDHESGRSKGFAFVEMVSEQAAQSAIAGLHGKPMQGRALEVKEAVPKGKAPAAKGGPRKSNRKATRSAGPKKRPQPLARTLRRPRPDKDKS